jgi:hypothetical protein
LWHGNFPYGKSGAAIDSSIIAIHATAPVSTQSAEMKFNITGHGSDNTGCAEFCKKYYTVVLNNKTIAQKDIWRDDCGSIPLYPQSGTWLYSRANWCPGDRVLTHTHVLTGVNAVNPGYVVDVDFQNYSGSGTGKYTVEGSVIYYGAFNHQTDVSLEDIIAPSDFEEYFRYNPVCGRPIVRIRNSGNNAVSSVTFNYGVKGSTPATYTWTGTIAPLTTRDIELPALPELNSVTGDDNIFTVQISKVNSQEDEDPENNMLTSVFQSSPSWPTRVIIQMKTNNFKANGETIWRIYDMNDHLVAQRSQTAFNTTYVDTVDLPPACYKLMVTDAGKDGLYWWANAGAGTGTFKVTSVVTGAELPLTGYFKGDFGSGFTQYFHTDWPAHVEPAQAENRVDVEIYPNPAGSIVYLKASVPVNITLTTLDGRKVMEHSHVNQINIGSIADGIYLLRVTDHKGRPLKHELLIKEN